MASLELDMHFKKRPAIYRPNKYRAHLLGIGEGVELLVDVLGIFQCSDDDGPMPYFVLELSTGKCCYAEIDEIQFTDKEGTPHVTDSH